MLFKNANIFRGDGFVHGSFYVENGRFGDILTTVPDADGVDLGGKYVIPGLVDVHNHGNSNADFSDGDYEGLVRMARYLAKNGVTSFALYFSIILLRWQEGICNRGWVAI